MKKSSELPVFVPCGIQSWVTVESTGLYGIQSGGGE